VHSQCRVDSWLETFMRAESALVPVYQVEMQRTRWSGLQFQVHGGGQARA
jgi:hypothetical protein